MRRKLALLSRQPRRRRCQRAYFHKFTSVVVTEPRLPEFCSSGPFYLAHARLVSPQNKPLIKSPIRASVMRILTDIGPWLSHVSLYSTKPLSLCQSCRCSMPVYMYACMCLDVRCGQIMCFDVWAAAPFDANRVRCQIMRFDVCAVRRSMSCEGSDESSIGGQHGMRDCGRSLSFT